MKKKKMDFTTQIFHLAVNSQKKSNWRFGNNTPLQSIGKYYF